MAQKRPQTVAIAGASGFVGQALVEALTPNYQVIALSRRAMGASQAPRLGRCSWRQVNLYNLRHTEQALEGAQIAYYLVHSMLPTARLSQGDFADLDLICADNFARAAKAAGVERIIYLGGLIPLERPLSHHLASRLEIEEALADHGVPLVSLRAGIVIGPRGSSFTMMMRLVERIPILILPKWTSSRCQPIALQDVVADLTAAADPDRLKAGSYDVGGPDILTYREMLERCARLAKRRRWFISVPLWTPTLSLWWVRWVTGVPYELVNPLVRSLRHDMVVRKPLPALWRPTTGVFEDFDSSVGMALAKRCESSLKAPRRAKPTASMAASTGQHQRARGVISVQRHRLPKNRDAAWVAQEYSRFLPGALGLIGRICLRVTTTVGEQPNTHDVSIYLRGMTRPLLKLVFAPKRSDDKRQLYYLAEGLLTRPLRSDEPGRFEFRSVLNNKYVLTGIHDFVPRLPWFLYRFSQAWVHGLVMRRYRRHLGKS